MKTPDKIYVAESLIKTPYGNEWSPTPYISRENTEYIRKDALLEWAKGQKAWLKQGYKKDWKNEDTLNGGRLMLDKLINKIQSL